MTTDTVATATAAAAAAATEPTDSSTRSRVALLAIVLGVTAVLAIPAGLFWPEPAGGGETYSFSDIVGQRDLWWGLLTALGCALVINVPLQAIATMLLVRRRGSGWATTGAVFMWFGAALQGIGVAGWATAYFFPSDPSVGKAAGALVFDAVNDHMAHILGVMIPGAGLILVGTVLQAVALFRAHVVPAWVPWLTLFVIPTFFVPGNGPIGLITSVPMAAAAVGVGYYAWRRVS